MVFFKDLQEYIRHSTLLISARPATTKISTRYTTSSTRKRSRYQQGENSQFDQPSTKDGASAPGTPLQASLTLKTYDPVSGVVLKYKTDRAAEVGRLMAGLSRCGHVMAARPEAVKDAQMTDTSVDTGKQAGADSALQPKREERVTVQEQHHQQRQGKPDGAGKKKRKR